MTKDEFLDKLEALLKEYCYRNKDYQNIHERKLVQWVGNNNLWHGINISIEAYLTAKELNK